MNDGGTKDLTAARTALITYVARTWNGNRDAMGRIKNAAVKRREGAEQRRLAIAALGFQPEEGNDPGDRYAASTGEMFTWIAEAMKLETNLVTHALDLQKR